MDIRYGLDGHNLTLDIGNPVVAEKYAAFLTSELSTIKRNLENKTEPLDFILPGGIKMPFPPFILREYAAGLGVRDIRKLLPTDKDFFK